MSCMSDVEMVLPGRSAKDEIIEQADLVTAGIEHKREEGAVNYSACGPPQAERTRFCKGLNSIRYSHEVPCTPSRCTLTALESFRASPWAL